jgi:hypothetical protein
MLPVLSPDIQHTGQNIIVTLPPASIGFWVLPDVKVKLCLTAPVGSRSERSSKVAHHGVRSTNSRSHLSQVHSGQVRGEFSKPYSDEMKKKRHSKNHVLKSKDVTVSTKNMNGIKAVTDVDDFKSGNTKMIDKSDINVKRGERNDLEEGAHGRHRRYVLENGKYTIPGLQPDHFQPSNGVSIRNLIWRRNRAGRLQELARTSKQEGNIPTLLHKPHHQVGFEDMNEGFPAFNSDEYDMNPFPAGTIYIRQSGEPPGERNSDYDYIDKDDHMHDEDENILPEPKHFHGPAEYFEIFQKSDGIADEKFAGYDGELSEAESIVLIKSIQQEVEQNEDDDEDDDKVTQEQGPTEEEDRKAKAATDSMLQKYFTQTYKQVLSDEGEDFDTVRRLRENHKTDFKDKRNRRMPVERKGENSDEVISKIARHINVNPASSIQTVKTKKAIINDQSLHNKGYESYVSVEEAESNRSSHTVKEPITEEHDKNLPINAKEYYKEGSHASRRSQENGNSKKKQNSEEDDQDSYGKSSNYESPSASQSTTGQYKGRVRKVSHRVIYHNSDEDDNSSDTRGNYSKQISKNSVTQKPHQRRSEGSNEHTETESDTPKESQKYSVKSRPHNEDTHHKTHEYHKQIDSFSNDEDNIDARVMKTYSKKRKHERAPYQFQQNTGDNGDYKVGETDATVESKKLTENINLGYRKKSSRRAPSYTYSTTGQRATQHYLLFGEQSGEESDKYMRHSSRTEVTSNETEERSGIEEEEEESAQMNIKPNKSRQRNHITLRLSAGNREPRYRVRRDMMSQLPVLETSVENRQKETEVQNKDIELETETDPTNAKLQIKAQGVKKNKQLETEYENEPTVKIISSNDSQQWGTVQINKNIQNEIRGMSLVEDDYEETKESGTNSKSHSNRSMHYMRPEQLQNDGYVKHGTGKSLMYKPSNNITIMKVDAAKDDLKMADIPEYVDGVKKFLKTQDDALNMKLYQEAGIPVNRLPKAIAAHMNMQHHSAKVDTEGTESIKETHGKNVKNRVVTDEEMEKAGEWKVDIPVKTVEFQHAEESSLLQKEGKLSKEEHRSTLIPYDLVPESMTGKSNGKITVSVPDGNKPQWTQNQEINQREDRWLHSSDGQEPEKNIDREEIQHGGRREGLSHEEIMLGNKIENVKVPLEAGNQRPTEGKSSSEQDKQERVPEVFEKLSEDDVSVQSLATDMASYQTLSLKSNINSDSYDVTATESSEPQVQIVTKKLPVNDDIKGDIHSIIDITGTNVPKSSHAVKQNLKSVHDKVLKGEDEIFKITNNIRDSRSARQFSVNGDPDNYDLSQIVNLAPKQFNVKDGEQQQHHMLSAEEVLKNTPYFMDGNIAVSYNEKETDSTNDKLENFAEDYIDDNEDVSAALVRNAKHTGHLVPILPKKGKSLMHHVVNTNGHTRLQALLKTDHIKAELEKKRLERFHALTAQRAKLKEDLLKIKVMAAEGKLKLPHHIVRRDTTQNENIKSRMSNSVLDDLADHIKLQLPRITKTEKIKAELEKKRLERLHILAAQRARLKEDLLKIKVAATEGKLKLPHHIRRRDSTQDEHVELLTSDNESKDFQSLISKRNTDRKGHINRDNPSDESQNVGETESYLSIHKEESKDKDFRDDTNSWLEQILFPAASVTDGRYVQVPAFDNQEIYKPPYHSESEVIPREYVSVRKFVNVPKHEGQTLVEETNIFNSETSPLFMLYGMGPRPMYAESMFQESGSKERGPEKENISQEIILNSIPDQRSAEGESSGGHYIEIKQLSLPFPISRPALKNDPVRTQSKNTPVSKNDIRFFFGLETDEEGDDEDLTKMQVADSDYACSLMRLKVKDDASLNEKCGEQNAENTQASSMPVNEEITPNHQILLQANPLPEGLNKLGAGWDKRQENSKKEDELKYENKSGGKSFKSSNSIIQSSQQLNNEANSPTLRTMDTMKNSTKRSTVSKSSMLDEKRTHSMIPQSLTQDMDRNSEQMPELGNSHAVPIRSRRALAYQFKDEFNDNLLKPSILTKKDNPKIEDNMKARYQQQDFFKDTATSSENKQQSGELSSNMYSSVMVPESNALSFSNVTSENNTLLDMDKFKYNPDSIPANSFYVTDVELISDYESKDLKQVSHENTVANQTCLESLGNYLNDIINVEADDGTENNKKEGDLSETLNDVNLQTNEINRRFRTSDSFVKSKYEKNIVSSDNEQNIVATKIIPYELEKHVIISNYEPSYGKIRKYLYQHNYNQLAGSSEEFPSTEYLNPVNKLGNKFSHSKKTKDSSKLFSIILDKFPNIISKSIDISETATSNNTNITPKEIPKTAREFKDISKAPMSGNIMVNTDSENGIEPKVKKWKKESSLISQTHPKDEVNYPFKIMKNIAAVEQEPADLETVTNTVGNAGYLVITGQNTENVEAPDGQNKSDNNQEEKKQTETTGHIHKLIKNVADHVVKFFHKLSPWNYFGH